MVDTAREFLRRDGVNIVLPVDVVLAAIQPAQPADPAETHAGNASKMASLAHDNPANWHVRLRKVANEKLTVECCGPDAPCIPQNHYGVDIGPESVEVGWERATNASFGSQFCFWVFTGGNCVLYQQVVSWPWAV